MRTNNLGQSIFDNNDLIDIIYQGHHDKLSKLILESNTEILEFQTASDIVFQKESTDVDQQMFDQYNQHAPSIQRSRHKVVDLRSRPAVGTGTH